jgi:NAD(P)H-dependent FMN reductase
MPRHCLPHPALIAKTTKGTTMRIALISGSHRKASESSRVAAYLAGRLEALVPGTETEVIDLAGNPLPLWDETAWVAGSPLQAQWAPYATRLQAAAGLVVISPEWSGMVPPGLKNFFLLASPKEIGHKPALIVTVSAGRGGSYPVDELRISSYKNTRVCYIPEHLIVRNVGQMFKGDEPSGEDDAYLRGRANHALRVLLSYTAALTPMRGEGYVFDGNYPSGM